MKVVHYGNPDTPRESFLSTGRRLHRWWPTACSTSARSARKVTLDRSKVTCRQCTKAVNLGFSGRLG